jgi:hypothetical protein
MAMTDNSVQKFAVPPTLPLCSSYVGHLQYESPIDSHLEATPGGRTAAQAGRIQGAVT